MKKEILYTLYCFKAAVDELIDPDNKTGRNELFYKGQGEGHIDLTNLVADFDSHVDHFKNNIEEFGVDLFWKNIDPIGNRNLKRQEIKPTYQHLNKAISLAQSETYFIKYPHRRDRVDNAVIERTEKFKKLTQKFYLNIIEIAREKIYPDTLDAIDSYGCEKWIHGYPIGSKTIYDYI